MIVVLWRAGLRIQEALALAEHDLDRRRGSILIRNPDAMRNRSCQCNDAVKAHFEEVLRGVYPDPEKGN